MDQVINLELATWAPLLGPVLFDMASRQDGNPSQLYAWGIHVTGGTVLWSLDMSKPPGQMQRWAIVPDA